jgi:hypothetical protein
MRMPVVAGGSAGRVGAAAQLKAGIATVAGGGRGPATANCCHWLPSTSRFTLLLKAMSQAS